MDDQYLIWSEEHGKWWNPGRAGYTSRIRYAGRYPKDVAEAICKKANYGGTFNEIVVPLPAGIPIC